MAIKLPSDLEDEIFSEGVMSLKRGRAVRRLDVLLPAFAQAAVLILLVWFEIPDALTIAAIVIVSSLGVIWALMSVSASLNAQFDIISRILVYYGEKGRTGRPNSN